jgi:hypothetical protein
MNTRLMVATATVAMGLAGSVFAARASACAVLNASKWSDAPAGAAAQAAALFAGAEEGNAKSFPDGWGHGSIVGLWKFTFTAKGNPAPLPPDGFVLDAGFQTWHNDGTEITNSGRPAATGNFCMGVWEQHGNGYKLNHFALAWNPPGTDPTDFAGVANIREDVQVNRSGNTMTGTVTIDQYAPDGTTLVVHLTGSVAGTRVTVN